MTIAIFDLDKTITKRDTFLPFLLYIASKHRNYFKPFAKCFFLGLLFLLGITKRRYTKERFLQIFLKDNENINSLSHEFAKIFLKKYLILDAIKNIENHRLLGHRLVLASASPSIYVSEFAKLLNIEFVISAKCEIKKSGAEIKIHLYEDLIGEEKLNKIMKYFDLKNEDVWAYSDSKNDLHLLNEADYSFAINPRRSFRKVIEKDKKIIIFYWS